MRRMTATAVAIGMACGLGGCGYTSSNAPPRVEERRVLHLDHAGPLNVDVRTEYGDVDIAPNGTPLPGWAEGPVDRVDAGVTIVALVGSRDPERLPFAQVTPTIDGSGTLRLEATWPPATKDNLAEGVRYAVRVPGIVNATVLSEYGDIDLEGASGAASLTTDYGDVSARSHAGSLVVFTDYGDVDVLAGLGHRAPFEITSDYGDIEVEGVLSPLKVYSDYGDLVLRGVGGRLDAETEYGDVDVALTSANPGPIEVFTDYGDVEVVFGAAFAGTLTAETSHGEVTARGFDAASVLMNRKRTHAVIRVSPEGAASDVSTDYGDVRLERAGAR